MKNPFISIILPTYNNEATLNNCLNGIFIQDYDNFEVLVIDGSSTDKTLEISKKYKVKILNNPHRIEERARVLGIKKSKGEILCFIDADNIITEKDWLTKMVAPFKNKEIIGVDTYYYTFRKKDPLVTRYCSLIGGDDPIAIYLGLYDRYNYFKNRWTDFLNKEIKEGEYLKVKLNKEEIPAMGSNGFLYRKKTLLKINYEPFIHSDIIYKLADKGYFAKVNIGIVHIQKDVRDFFKKKIRRIKRRLSGEIKLEHNYGVSTKKLFFTSIYLLLILPVLYDTLKGFIRKPTLVWLFHPIATYGVLFLYLYYFTIGKLFIKRKDF